jgi:hypothetical protein
MTDPNAQRESQVAGESAHDSSPIDIRETRLADGTKIVVVNGVPYADPDPEAARVEGAVDRLRTEAEAWGVVMGYRFVILPVLVVLLVCVAALAGGVADLFSGHTLSHVVPPLATIAFIGLVIAAGVIFVRRYPGNR